MHETTIRKTAVEIQKCKDRVLPVSSDMTRDPDHLDIKLAVSVSRHKVFVCSADEQLPDPNKVDLGRVDSTKRMHTCSD